MTKNELAEQVARRNGLSASQARQVLESTIEVVSDELAAGGEVALAGFGKFRQDRGGRRRTGGGRTAARARRSTEASVRFASSAVS